MLPSLNGIHSADQTARDLWALPGLSFISYLSSRPRLSLSRTVAAYYPRSDQCHISHTDFWFAGESHSAAGWFAGASVVIDCAGKCAGTEEIFTAVTLTALPRPGPKRQREAAFCQRFLFICCWRRARHPRLSRAPAKSMSLNSSGWHNGGPEIRCFPRQ